MTTYDTTTPPSTTTATPATATWPLRRVGAVALAAGPLLFAAGLATAPHQETYDREGFVASLIGDPTAAVTSANLLHYSWLAWVVGLIGVLGLVQGRGRGHLFTRVCAVLGILGAVQISGLLLGDLMIVAAGEHLTVAQTYAALDDLGTSALVWTISAQVLALLPVPLVFAGLARAGYLRWYLAAPVFIAPFVGGVPLPLQAGVVVGLVCQAAVFLVAVTMWRGTAPRRPRVDAVA